MSYRSGKSLSTLSASSYMGDASKPDYQGWIITTSPSWSGCLSWAHQPWYSISFTKNSFKTSLFLLVASYIRCSAMGIIGIWLMSVWLVSVRSSLLSKIYAIDCSPQNIISGILPVFLTCLCRRVLRFKMELVTFNLDQVIMWKQESQSHWSDPYFSSAGL